MKGEKEASITCIYATIREVSSYTSGDRRHPVPVQGELFSLAPPPNARPGAKGGVAPALPGY